VVRRAAFSFPLSGSRAFLIFATESCATSAKPILSQTRPPPPASKMFFLFPPSFRGFAYTRCFYHTVRPNHIPFNRADACRPPRKLPLPPLQRTSIDRPSLSSLPSLNPPPAMIPLVTVALFFLPQPNPSLFQAPPPPHDPGRLSFPFLNSLRLLCARYHVRSAVYLLLTVCRNLVSFFPPTVISPPPPVHPSFSGDFEADTTDAFLSFNQLFLDIL